MALKVGDKFSSYEDVESAIRIFSKENTVDLHKRDSRTLGAAVRQKRITEDRGVKNGALKYYQIKYACIFGGRDNYKARGQGSRKTKTFQCGCPYSIELLLTDDGYHLEIKSFNREHKNHKDDGQGYAYLPKSRKLNEEDRAHVTGLIAIGANKKLIQKQMSTSTGKSITMKDLSNIENRYKNNRHQTKNDIAYCVEKLRNEHKCYVDLSVDSEDTFCVFFAQDELMRSTFEVYPEIIFLDATYKLLELKFPVYLFVVEDANGEGEIVGLGSLVHEDAESLEWLVQSFIERNPNIKKTRLVMADKDMKERDVVKRLLPWAKVLICLFHALKTFRREVTMDAMQISSQTRENCLQVIQMMCYAKSTFEYDGHYKQFCNIAPSTVRTYFDSNWHPIREGKSLL